ncbi:MAG: hypothetical protein WBF64_09660 [Xanthobacteraceae bacterium]
MKSLSNKSLITKSLVRTTIIVASLALAGNAFAANAGHVAAKTSHTAHHVVHRVAAGKYSQFAQRQFDLPNFIAATFGGFAVPLVTHASQTTGTHATAASSDDNSQVFDQSPAAVEVDNSQSQAAIDASDQAMQQEDQSLQDMNASNAAAEAQNDAANAATQQYLTNNGM